MMCSFIRYRWQRHTIPSALNYRLIEEDGFMATHLFYAAAWQLLGEESSSQTIDWATTIS